MILGRESISKMASDALVWLCVKDNNSFIRKNKCAQTKRNGQITLSAEPGNLTSLSSFKYSGIANSKVIKFDVEDTATAGKTEGTLLEKCRRFPQRTHFAAEALSPRWTCTETKCLCVTRAFRSKSPKIDVPRGGRTVWQLLQRHSWCRTAYLARHRRMSQGDSRNATKSK